VNKEALFAKYNSRENYLIYKFEKNGGFLMLLNFAWKCFSSTGSIEAYLLYKELKRAAENRNRKEEGGGKGKAEPDSPGDSPEGV